MLKRGICSVVWFLVCLPFSMDIKADITQVPGTKVFVRVNDKNEEIEVLCSFTSYTGDDGAKGCNDAKYEYDVIASPSWPVTFGNVQYTLAQHKAYWDWVYAGYIPVGTANCDWSKNCHGYAFGVGNWPANSTLLKADGATRCWFDDISNATIADNTRHTIKITVSTCSGSIGKKITATSEKFQESGLYGLSCLCTGPGINLALGNSPRGGMDDLIPYRK